MEIRNRLFPYPVLCEDTDDYVEGEFYVEAKLVEQGLNDVIIGYAGTDIHDGSVA